jgi:hypothetical protein
MIRRCLLAAGLGKWVGNTYHPIEKSNPYTESTHIPRVLLLGDSISRNMVSDMCNTLTAEDYIACPGSMGPSIICKTPTFEIANFFFLGSFLLGPYAHKSWGGHTCSSMPDDSFHRFHDSLSHVKPAFGGHDPTVVVFNAQMWTVQSVVDNSLHMDGPDFQMEYVSNITNLVRIAKTYFPDSIFLYLKVPIGSWVHREHLRALNDLVELAAQVTGDCVFDWERMMSSYTDGPVIQPDGRHPTYTSSIEAARVLFKISSARNTY